MSITLNHNLDFKVMFCSGIWTFGLQPEMAAKAILQWCLDFGVAQRIVGPIKVCTPS